MAIGDKKVFTINDSGVTLKITALDNGDGTVTFNIESLAGSASADINALFWSDGDSSTGNEKLATTVNGKVDNSLNMNGTKEAWDGSIGLSATGLGKEGANKATFLTEGNSLSTTQTVDFDSLQTLGIRATSIEGGSSMKGIGAGFEFIPAPVDNDPDYFPELGHALSYATFYFSTEEAAVAAADTRGDVENNGKGSDGVYTVKVDFSGAGKDLDDYYQNILDALINKGPITADTAILGVSVHAGGGSNENFFAYDANTGSFLDMGLYAIENNNKAGTNVFSDLADYIPDGHLVLNSYTDMSTSYGDLVG